MILDAGLIAIHRVSGIERTAASSVEGLPMVYRNWCGTLGHESGNAGSRVRRIRIHDADVQEHDIAAFDGRCWIVTRIYHGADDDTGQPIADLTMETGEKHFQRLTLIATRYDDGRVDENGFDLPPTETRRDVWCMVSETAHREYTESNVDGVRAEIKINVYALEYNGEMLAEYMGGRYTVENTHTQGGALITLTLDNAAEGGANGGKV